jgi:hypothetical protein
VKPIRSAEPYSPSTGPESRSTPTSESSTRNLFGDESISSQADSRAKTSARPGRVPGSEENAPVCGAKWRGSSPEYLRASSSLRTFLLCELEALTGYSLTWRRLATTHGRWWWALGRSALHTGEIASGSWGTPRVTDNGGHGRDRGNNRARLEDQVHADWRTVTARDCESPAKVTRGANATPGGTPLVVAMQEARAQTATGDWPTPAVVQRSNRGGQNPGPERLSLEDSARAWPTPTEGDGKASGSRIGNPNTKAHPGTSLTDATARDWSTPNTMTGGQTSRGGSRIGEKLLGGQVRSAGLPDPASRNTNGKNQDSWPTPRNCTAMQATVNPDATFPNLETIVARREKQRGQLNSRWVAQLMGFPSDWCELDDATIAKLSELSATRSSQRLPKRS